MTSLPLQHNAWNSKIVDVLVEDPYRYPVKMFRTLAEDRGV